MTGTVRRYFARGNTAHGAHFLYHSAFQSLERLFLLTGLPGTGKSTAIRRLADEMVEQGWDVELFHSPLYPDDLDAMIIPKLKTAIADERACEGTPYADISEIVRIDFGEAVDKEAISVEVQEAIEGLQAELMNAYTNAYDTFASALRVHDDWEKVYIGSMDFAKADKVAKDLAASLFSFPLTGKQASVRHLFFGAATQKGATDHIQNLTSRLEKRIFIKGRAGSGKSTVLKHLAAVAEKNGYDVETFHCGFDPNSLDMLIFPELSLAIFDSTQPHEYFPERGGDVILDMYELAIPPGTDEKYAAVIAPIKQKYSQTMKQAIAYLAEAQQIDLRIKGHYMAAVDYKVVDRLQGRLRQEVHGLAEQLQ